MRWPLLANGNERERPISLRGLVEPRPLTDPALLNRESEEQEMTSMAESRWVAGTMLPEYDPATEQGYMATDNPGMVACTQCGSVRYRCARCGLAIGTPAAPGGPHRLPPPYGTRSANVDVTVCDPCRDAVAQQVTDALPWRPEAGTTTTT